MYHIKEDKRSIRSADRIFTGLSRCLERKRLSDITISEICETSQVGRATFYRIFDTISDVLYMGCDRAFKEVLQGFVDDTDTVHESRFSLLEYYLQYWYEHYRILETLIRANRIDIIYDCHQKNSRIISDRFRNVSQLTDTEHRYFISMRSGVTLSMLVTWIEGGREESVEEISALLKRIYHVTFDNPGLLL